MKYREAKKLRVGDIIRVIPSSGYIPILVEVIKIRIAEKDIFIQGLKRWQGDKRISGAAIRPKDSLCWVNHKDILEKYNDVLLIE